MPINNDKFDQLKIDKLKHFLEDMASKGYPKPFEIFVDNLKVVPKTEDPKDFDNYEYYVHEDTQKIRILIYNSSSSPRNDQYSFCVQEDKKGKGLNGLGEIDNLIKEKIEARDREHEVARTKLELEDTLQRLEKAEDYIEDLENRLEIASSNKYKFKNLDLLDFGASVLGRFAERNAGVLAQYGLEGFGGQSTKEAPANSTVEGGPRFKKERKRHHRETRSTCHTCKCWSI